jgi:hypothetical protein
MEADEIDQIELSAEDQAMIDDALKNARDPYDHEVAVSAEYDALRELLIVKLKTGERLAIPRENLQGLATADPALVAKVELEMLGMSLHWEELDMDFLVDRLRQGSYGSERWMRELRRKHQADLPQAS